MKFKKIMLVTLMLLAILTVGAVSASENATVEDDLAASDVTEDPIEEAPADDVILEDSKDFSADDFNVWVTNKTLDVDKDMDETVFTFTSPQGASGDFDIFLNNKWEYCVTLSNETAGKTFNVSLSDLSPSEYGTLPVSFRYDFKETFSCGTLTVVKYYSKDDFDTTTFDEVRSETYRLYNFNKVPAFGNLVIYVDGNMRYNEYINEKSPYKSFYVADLNITDNGDYNIQTEYIINSSGQTIPIDDFNVSVSCMPVSLFITSLSIDVADKYLPANLGYVYDDNFVQGTVTGYLDGNQVFTKECDISEYLPSVKLEGFSYYDGFELGNHTVKIVYVKSNGKTYAKEGTVTFYADPTVINPYSLNVGDKKYITVNYYKGATGTLIVYNTEKDNSTVGWKKADVFMTMNLNGSGSVSIPLDSLDEGYHGFCLNITLGTYSVEKYVDVNVLAKPDTRAPVAFGITVNDDKVIEFGDDITIAITSSNTTFSGNVLVKIGEIEVTAAIINGAGSVKFSSFDVGTYTVQVSSNATETFRAGQGSGSFEVKKALSHIYFNAESVDLDAGTPLNLTVGYDGASAIVAKIDNESVTVNGNVIMIPALSGGTYELHIITLADGNHSENEKSVTLRVAKPKSHISFTDSAMVFDYGSSGTIGVIVLNGSVGDVRVIGYDTAGIDVNGSQITVSRLNAGKYILSVTTNPDENYEAVTGNVTLTVNALKTTITPESYKITTTYGTSKSILVTLTDVNGNVLAIRRILTDMRQPKPTNALGKTIVTVPNNLAVKNSYTLTITFAGDNNFAKSTAKVTVVVNKATPKLTASAKTFKRSDKNKKYTVTLKTDKNAVYKNAKLTITVNKKTYSGKTNAKGQVTFKLTKLTKKGKYAATVKFAGDAKYKAVTKKNVKITVK